MMASLSARRRSTLVLSSWPEILTWQRSEELILPSALMALLMNTKGLAVTFVTSIVCAPAGRAWKAQADEELKRS
jgi:hypothetical protein